MSKFSGWFATSFWVDAHYLLAAVATLELLVVYAATRRFDLGFASFVSAMWTTAIANDKMNMPPVV